MPKVVTIMDEQPVRSVTPYRAAPERRKYKAVGPSPMRQYAALAWVCGVTPVTAFWLPWYVALVSNSVVWVLVFSWARAWRTARLWQRIAYQHCDDLPEDLELDRPFGKQLLEDVAAATALRRDRTVADLRGELPGDEDVPLLSDAAREWLATNEERGALTATAQELNDLRAEMNHMQHQLMQQRFEYERATRTLGHELREIYTEAHVALRSKT